MREYRGTLTEPGKESPYRSRSSKETLDLLQRMRSGEFVDGSRVLRAKIDMASPNLNLRDPVLYRILRATHPRTGDAWCIYPMYDFAHGQSDSIEKITHSLCTLEFQDHRPLYDWLCEALEIYHPQQIEFARLNLTYTVMSKRRLLELVNEKHVSGWDDPRMPTLSGMRRRGFTAAAIRTFCTRIGVGKSDSVIDMSVLEDCVREDLDQVAPRAMGVLRPLKVTITNYPEGQTEEFVAARHPKDPSMGTRTIPFSREIYVDRDDFMEDPPKKFFRLGPGREVRLRYGYVIRCDEVIKDPASGEVTELRCSYDAETGGGTWPEGRKKVKGLSTGSLLRMPCRSKSVFMIVCSALPIRRQKKVAIIANCSTKHPLKSLRRRLWNHALPRWLLERFSSLSAWVISVLIVKIPSREDWFSIAA